jgi:hypothetical protein
MRILLTLLLIVSASGCGKSQALEPVVPVFQTDRLSNGMLRLENNEVVCYRYDGGGLSCKFKE